MRAMLKPRYPYFLANSPVFANEALEVTDKFTHEVATRVALADARKFAPHNALMTVARAAHCPPLALFHDVMARCRPSGNASPEPFEASTREENARARERERESAHARVCARSQEHERERATQVRTIFTYRASLLPSSPTLLALARPPFAGLRAAPRC
jgi:hypothetical protein